MSLHGPVVVMGAGLLGTSVGLALRARGIDVLLDDLDEAHLRTARGLGAGVPLAERAPEADRLLLPAVHLLAGIGLALMVGLRDPLRKALVEDRLEHPELARAADERGWLAEERSRADRGVAHPEELARLRAHNLTTPPAQSWERVVDATLDEYARARSLHEAAP